MAHTHNASASRRGDAARTPDTPGTVLRLVVGLIAGLAALLGFALAPLTAPSPLSAAAPRVASAADALGTLTVSARWGSGAGGSSSGTPLVGDTFSLTRVAAADLDGSGAIGAYHTLDAFASYDAVWGSLTSSELNAAAKRLDAFAARQGLYAASGVTDAQGQATFAGLEPGLYLVARTGVADANARYVCDPFLVAVPESVNGVPTMHVTAEPKFGDGGNVTPPDPDNPGPTPDPDNPSPDNPNPDQPTPGTPETPETPGAGGDADCGTGCGTDGGTTPGADGNGGSGATGSRNAPSFTASTGAAVTGIALLAIVLAAVAIVLRAASRRIAPRATDMPRTTDMSRTADAPRA
ncbi:cell surface protein [Bifidobacterium sp. DSM 109958]|uniref:Cell surface protein n=1 Tax=Bifidobacterium moraviense TaxID=2675323 RepID=A0A7Y0HZ81_9BIFI|nr:hypothetical protein [Bifidobacterium sp. DSM 109958]NMN01162.1 cell surface protein [Bifidobacterium sp. DSM 109958]